MANTSGTSKLDQDIDENLRRVYAEMAQEPLPDRFTQLLDQLREKEKSENERPPKGDQ